MIECASCRQNFRPTGDESTCTRCQAAERLATWAGKAVRRRRATGA